MIPRSYPGHALLTEDKGIILGEDDCPCGRFGKYFKVTGRIPKAEIRGCSDTYAQDK
ncbi:MAG: LuxE/PaaK family acyltransferase [Ruminiclostridium sp.]